MWKDFFYFSKGQRTGILVLIVLIVLVLVVNYSLPYFFQEKPKDGTAFLKEVETFKKSLVSRDSLQNAIRQQQYLARQRQYEERYQKYKATHSFPSFKKKAPYSLFAFDPNVVDSTVFVKLGLKPFTASNILKYRRKAGWFRTKEAFGKVYGISPEKYKELEPYISIHEKPLTKADSIYLIRKEAKKNILVELNSADTTLLMQVTGIGRGYAKGIVRFRQLSGGFVSVEQLGEINGMRPENLALIRPYCTVNTALVRKIKVNIASVERLKGHPYLNFYQSKAIYELRRKKGKLKDISDLNVLPEFTPESLAKIKPYLSFE